MLLFHGTMQSCVLSIFKQDFALDPTKLKNAQDLGVKIAGKMFGYGVYFADMSTKSFNYTRAQSTNDIGCLIVAEIAVGKTYNCRKSDFYANKKTLDQKGCDSTKGLGKWAPSSTTNIKGIAIPNGKCEETKENTVLRYNEYIVYDTNQILIKYLILTKNVGGYGGY